MLLKLLVFMLVSLCSACGVVFFIWNRKWITYDWYTTLTLVIKFTTTTRNFHLKVYWLLNMLLKLFSNFFLSIFYLFTGSALKCYRCTSDSSASFCDDPFDPSVISENQRRWTYIDCKLPPQQGFGIGDRGYNQPQQKAVCKKVKQLGKCNDLFIVAGLVN